MGHPMKRTNVNPVPKRNAKRGLRRVPGGYCDPNLGLHSSMVVGVTAIARIVANWTCSIPARFASAYTEAKIPCVEKRSARMIRAGDLPIAAC